MPPRPPQSPALSLSLSLPLLLAAALALAAGLPRRPQPLAPAQDPDPGTAPLVEGHLLRHRWLLVQNNFQVEANVARVNALLDRAKAAGFNGAVFSDVKFGRLDDGSLIEAYPRYLRQVLDHARALGLTVLPATADFGYSESILWHDPNLAEGLPVRGEPYVLRDGRLLLDDPDAPRLPNGDFEQLPTSGDAFPGWDYQDAPGQASFVDRAVRRGGQASLRMEDLGRTNAPSGNGRVYKRLAVRPFSHHHLRVWVKTAGFEGGEVRALVLGQGSGRTLQWNSIPVRPTQDWTAFDVTFNSLDHAQVAVYLGVWGGRRGRIWWDDALLEPAGPVNLVRRQGAPLQARLADGRELVEGQDLARVEDPRTGLNPWPGNFDLWHEPPEIKPLPGGRLREGDRLLLDYHHTALVYGGQVTASLLEPAALDIVRAQLAGLRREFAAAGAFSGWMLSHDEIRVHGWDQAPKAGSGRPGENLAQNLRELQAAAQAIDPAGRLYVWSDMFDPQHNAADSKEPYYLVNGSWAGSWEGLAPGVGVINWNSQADKRRASAAFFAGRGHRQILAGYYDQDPTRFGDRAWLADLRGLPGIEGVLYAQWGSGYDQLEAWARHVWGDAAWVAEGATPSAAPGGSTTPAAASATPVAATRTPDAPATPAFPSTATAPAIPPTPAAPRLYLPRGLSP